MAWMETETLIRAGAFIVFFALLAVTEVLAPRRKLSVPKPHRWRTNLTLIALDPLSTMLIDIPSGRTTLQALLPEGSNALPTRAFALSLMI